MDNIKHLEKICVKLLCLLVIRESKGPQLHIMQSK